MNDKHEQAIRALYRQSGTEQPSMFVDKRIRKAARRALYRNKKHWLWSLSTAAVMVLSLTVVLRLYDIEPETQEILWEQELKQPVLKRENSLAKQKAYPAPAPMLESSPVILAPEEEVVAETPSINTEEQKRHRVKSPARSFAKKEKIESSSMDSMASPASVLADKINTGVDIPELPLQLNKLIQLDESLSGEQRKNGVIQLYSSNQLILSLSPVNNGFTFKAWQGSEIIGISVDWGLTAVMLKQCIGVNENTICSLTDQVKAVFIKNRLDHISWQVTHE